MSRTRNTDPYHVQRERAEAWRERGYPPAWGGAWCGAKELRKRREGGVRALVRDELRKGKEPEPTRHRHSAKWDLY